MSSDISRRVKQLENRVAALEEGINMRSGTTTPKIPPPLMSAQTNGKRKRWVDVAEALRHEIETYNEGKSDADRLIQFETADNKTVNTRAKRYLGNILQEAFPELYSLKTWDQVQRSYPKRAQQVVKTAARMYEFRVFVQAEGNWAIRVLLDEKMKSAKDTADAKRKRSIQNRLAGAKGQTAIVAEPAASLTSEYSREDGLEGHERRAPRTNAEDGEDANEICMERESDEDHAFGNQDLERTGIDETISRHGDNVSIRNSDEDSSYHSGESKSFGDVEELLHSVNRSSLGEFGNTSDEEIDDEPIRRGYNRSSHRVRKKNYSSFLGKDVQPVRVHHNVRKRSLDLIEQTNDSPHASRSTEKGVPSKGTRRQGSKHQRTQKPRARPERASKLPVERQTSEMPQAQKKLTQKSAANVIQKRTSGKEPITIPRKRKHAALHPTERHSSPKTPALQKDNTQKSKKTPIQRQSTRKPPGVPEGRKQTRLTTHDSVSRTSRVPSNITQRTATRKPSGRISKKNTGKPSK